MSQSGNAGNGAYGDMLVSELLKRVERDDVTPRHPQAATERRRVLRLFGERFGPQPMSQISPVQVLDWIREQPGLRSDWSRRRWLGTIKSAFNQAKQSGVLARNPLDGARFGAGGRGRDLTATEWRKAIRHSRPAYRRILFFLRWTGCRPAEARALRWSDIRWDTGAIVLRQHKTFRTTGRPRVIFLPGPAIRLLDWLRRGRFLRDQCFLNHYEQPWTLKALVRGWDAIRQRSGLPTDAKLYSVRHTYATRTLVAGVDLKTVSELLGHRSVVTTEWYTHLAGKDDHLKQAAEVAGKAALKE